MLASQSTPMQQFLLPMPPSPPSRAATPSSSFTGPPPLSATAVSLLSSSQSADLSHFLSPPISPPATFNGIVHQQESTAQPSTPDPNADVDPQIIEALKSKDRIFVLKLGETMESLIREPSKTRMDATPVTSYQRMLVHRCSSFYKTALEVDQITKVFYITLTPESRIPDRKISDLVPAEPMPQPAIKIMRRTAQDRKPKSQTNSVSGDDVEMSDVEPSETGSLGGKSTSTSGHTKKRPTIEEREAAYKEARSRIFMGFEEKEKGNMNASSSSLSLTSSSAGAGSSVGDLEESSSPATESEWSTSNVRENRKDLRRGSGASSSRNGRSNFSGPTSVRNSRASSPSFKYASIYDSPPSASYYDPHVPYHEPPNPGYHLPQYPAPYPLQGHPPSVPFSPSYPYYPPYNPYQPPPQPQPHPTDCMPPTNSEMYANPMGPGSNFAWQNQPPPPHMQLPQPPPQPHSSPNHMINAPPHPGQAPYVPYAVPPYSYPAPGYYQPSPPGQMVAPYPNPPPLPIYEVSRPPNGNVSSPHTGRPCVNNTTNGANNGRNARNSSGSGMNGVPKGRSGPTGPPTRSGWSYGPGIGMGGYVTPQSSGDVVGPRLSSARRQSGNGVGNSAYSRTSSINDDVSSTASSSTTSSSSRRTYISTASSQHPLPPRPDWAVGMTPSNPPHGRHHHEHSSRSMPSTSTVRNGSNAGPVNMVLPPSGPSPLPQHPTDFPPLTPAAIPERHLPNSTTTGVWSNPNSRAVLSPTLGQQQHPSAKCYLGFAHNMPIHQFDDSDRSFERPPPKSTELYNHKSGKRGPPSSPQDSEREQRAKNESLVEQIAAMGIREQSPLGSASVNGTVQESSSVLTVST